MDVISRNLVTQVGWWLGNNHGKFAISDVNHILADIDESVRKIDSELCSKVSQLIDKDRELYDKIREISTQIERNSEMPSILWENMVNAWADQELLKAGKYVTEYGTISKITEKFVMFTNGYRKSIDNINYGRVFSLEHPEIEKLHVKRLVRGI